MSSGITQVKKKGNVSAILETQSNRPLWENGIHLAYTFGGLASQKGGNNTSPCGNNILYMASFVDEIQCKHYHKYVALQYSSVDEDQ